MEEKVAVRTGPREIWDKVWDTLENPSFSKEGWQEDFCLEVSPRPGDRVDEAYFKHEGYTIITPGEYFKRAAKVSGADNPNYNGEYSRDVKAGELIKITDKEEEVEPGKFGGCKIPKKVTNKILQDSLDAKYCKAKKPVICSDILCRECILDEDNTEVLREYLKTKPKAIKGEDTMNSSIRKIFARSDLETAEKIQAHFGAEIDETFTGEINLKVNKQKYLDEIKRREDEAAKDEEKANS